MAGGLQAFFAQNALPVENVKVAVSTRFVDEKGGPMQWEVRPVSGDEDEALRRKYTRMVQAPGKRGQYRQEFDANGYLAAIAARATVFPNLDDKGLQDSYGVMGAEAALKTMLLAGEYQEYLKTVQEISGFTPLEEQVDDAKN